MMTQAVEQKINPLLKLVLEIGPLVVFFLCFQYGEDLLQRPDVFDALASVTGSAALEGQSGPIFLATAVFMVAIAMSLGTSWALVRSLPRMAVVTGVVVAVFGGLTLWLQDETFIKMKPTIVNGTFALILGFGLMQGRSYLKYLMGEAMPLTDEGWMIFTRRWVMFFIFLAIVNEVVWRTQTTEFWVSFKTFGNLPLTFLFVALQWPLLQRHGIEQREDAG
ncbi:MAG: septation protein A [Pseudomonadota bacterium]